MCPKCPSLLLTVIAPEDKFCCFLSRCPKDVFHLAPAVHRLPGPSQFSGEFRLIFLYFNELVFCVIEILFLDSILCFERKPKVTS